MAFSVKTVTDAVNKYAIVQINGMSVASFGYSMFKIGSSSAAQAHALAMAQALAALVIGPGPFMVTSAPSQTSKAYAVLVNGVVVGEFAYSSWWAGGSTVNTSYGVAQAAAANAALSINSVINAH